MSSFHLSFIFLWRKLKYILIVPSTKRAIELNKAYKVIVDEQSFIYGRDAHIAPTQNVYEEVEVDQKTGLKAVKMERYPLKIEK